MLCIDFMLGSEFDFVIQFFIVVFKSTHVFRVAKSRFCY